MGIPKGCATGWIQDEEGVEQWLNDAANSHPVYSTTPNTPPCSKDDPVFLYEAVLELKPDWDPTHQGSVGWCVGVGFENAVTCTLANQLVLTDSPELWRGPIAGEAIYGGSRVEARGKRSNTGGDGSYGAVACKWLKQWGALNRHDYTPLTRRRSHNLRSPSAAKARDWGRYGCGGRSDRGKLDMLARSQPVQTAALCLRYDEAATAISNGYSIPVCSTQGFSSTRDKEGFCRPSGTWNHCMAFIGVRFDRPGLLCLNSWGNYVRGPMFPEESPKNLLRKAFWVDAAVVERMLARRDSYALSGVDGYVKQDVVGGVRKFRDRRRKRQERRLDRRFRILSGS